MTDIFTSQFLKFARIMVEADPECAQVPDVFYPEDGLQPSASTKLAKEICERCPIMNECAQYALEANETHGIWGGMTAFERRQLRKKSKI
jgi:WhiB family redox-sensing transcriptional regulator